jgi:hypothetical protein
MLGSTETRLSYATQGGVDVSSISPDAPLVSTGPNYGVGLVETGTPDGRLVFLQWVEWSRLGR